MVVDAAGQVAIVNDEAQRLLGWGPDAQGRPVAELPAPAPLRTLLVSGRAAADEVHLAGGRLVVVNQRPVAPRRPGAADLGTVLTLRDHTEVARLVSCEDVADAAGIARVTARRYLEHLAGVGLARCEPRYGAPGRPVHRYRWHGAGR